MKIFSSSNNSIRPNNLSLKMKLAARNSKQFSMNFRRSKRNYNNGAKNDNLNIIEELDEELLASARKPNTPGPS